MKVYSKQRATKSKQLNIIIPPKKRAEVGLYHQNGTGPYTIKPKGNNLLGPIFNSSGERFFAKEVNHPGISQREWFGITKKQEKNGLRLMEKAIDRLLKNA